MKKKLMFRITFMFFSISLIQISTSAQVFMMSSVGGLSGTNNNISSINFRSTSMCIDVQSGLAIYNSTNSNGLFLVNCFVSKKINSIGVMMYPNPVVNSCVLKISNTSTLDEKFSVTIMNVSGQIFSSRLETGYSLLQGVKMDVSDLSSSVYFLKIESPKYVETFKFFKAN